MNKNRNGNRSFGEAIMNGLLAAALSLCFASILASPALAAFKDDGWGARPLGFAGAFTSLADDVNAPLFNPAGTAQIRRTEMSFTYAKLFLGLELNGNQISSNYAAVAQPLGRAGTVGLIWANQGAASLYREDTFLLNYSHKLNHVFTELPFDLLVGGNLKYLYSAYTLDQRTVGDSVFAQGRVARAFAFDAGVMMKFERDAIGFSFKNLNQPNVGLLLRDNVPREFRLGVSRVYHDFLFFNQMTPTLDITYRDEIDPDLLPRAGFEGWTWDRHVALRAGGHPRELTFGFGYNSAELMKKLELQFDYAFVMPLTIDDSNGTHRFSLTMRFDGESDVPMSKIENPTLRRQKVMKMWNEYLELVQSGASLSERRSVLKKFIKRYRYSGVDISFAKEEYQELMLRRGK